VAADEKSPSFEDGMKLGVWLESEVRPQLKRWSKSADARVHLTAAILSDIIEDAHTRGDWTFLARLHDGWVKHQAATVEAAVAAAEARE
jgi:hypothetical protein